ncbi:DnaB-like helicase C-terminal domain protein [Anaerofustis stercorihominis DSM 17244]|uniref:DnaB-like helicase C-terminal domain protein n=1 Tax=Anaerofustis stercorihominis DSM 17244 TaxID=445971 RepID=B1CC75_9FIRM|nr:DnaB-like helicase C-terminal domain-containing protein [Anaerofustis stercorihominis]EDS71872.1 DnaB-like helicase C-terminal domain protein [Anaerofustis stercorihominis DSM 17244]
MNDSERKYHVNKILSDTTGYVEDITEEDKKKADKYRADIEEYNLKSEYHRAKDFYTDIKNSINKPYIPTGFYNLDQELDGGLKEGIYFIGAISSLGKTTFCLQLAYQMARQNQDVLFISLEQSANELRAKSISRNTYILSGVSKHLAKSANIITDYEKISKFNEFEKELYFNALSLYREESRNLFIIESVYNYGVKELEEDIKKHIDFRNKKPVVFIDYVQILSPINDRYTDKQNTDRTVTNLRRLARDNHLTIFGISSFNRDNYNNPVTMTAFKESGAIEYSSDVLIGLQPQGLQFAKNNTEKEENRKIIEECKLSDERYIELVILKNRNGRTGGKVFFKFIPKYNYFEETDKHEEEREEVKQETIFT